MNKKTINPSLENLYTIKIETNLGQVIMSFTNQAQGLQEYEKIRSSGVYCGAWINSITSSNSQA